jgi:hypothetical protein
MARMRDIKTEAKKKRAKLLAYFNKMPPGYTITELADKHGVSRQRMHKLIMMARKEAENA